MCVLVSHVVWQQALRKFVFLFCILQAQDDRSGTDKQMQVVQVGRWIFVALCVQ